MKQLHIPEKHKEQNVFSFSSELWTQPNRLEKWVIVKKSSPKVVCVWGKTCWPTVSRLWAGCWLTVSRQSANRRPTVGRQSADSRPTVGRPVFWGALLQNYRKMYHTINRKCYCYVFIVVHRSVA